MLGNGMSGQDTLRGLEAGDADDDVTGGRGWQWEQKLRVGSRGARAEHRKPCLESDEEEVLTSQIHT